MEERGHPNVKQSAMRVALLTQESKRKDSATS